MSMLQEISNHKVRVVSGFEYELEEKVNNVIAEEYAKGKAVKQIVPLGDSAEIDQEDTSSIKTPMPMVMILFEQMKNEMTE